MTLYRQAHVKIHTENQCQYWRTLAKRHEHLTWSPSYEETPDTGAAQAASVPPQHSHSHRSELTAQGPDAANTTPASCIVPSRSVDI